MEAKHKFKNAYHEMADSKEVWEMKLAGCIMKDMFSWIDEHDKTAAQHFADIFDGNLHFYNYMTEEEAMKIVRGLKHQGGETGARWKAEEVWAVSGDKKSCEPYYNCWALYATMNMLDSDHRKTLMPLTNTYETVILEMALEKLKDVDREKFVREYFELDCD